MISRSQTASVTLVALCCVAVLAIALASYLAVSNEAMKLSNRTYARNVSRQLAEMGFERALRSYTFNTWGSWTPDTTPPTTTRRTFTIASSNYGSSGITTAINLRVDHYNAVPWSAVANYTTNSMVWYRGNWFQCISANLNQIPPNATYWTSAPARWGPNPNYNVGDIALIGGNRYVCTVAHINQSPPNASYWSASASAAAWSALTAYALNSVALSGGTPYRCISAHTNHAPPNATYWVSAPVIYSEGVATLNDRGSTTIKTQLRASLAPAPLFPNAAAATTLTNLSAGGTVDSYNSVLGAYNSTSAPYSVANPNIGSSAVLAGGYTAGTAVAITTTRVNGYAAVPSSGASPYNPLLTNSGTGILTSTAAPAIPAPRMDLTRVSRSPFLPQFDIQNVTATNFLSVPSGTTTIPNVGTDTISADGRYYYYTNTDLSLSTGDTLNINGPVVIDIRPSATTKLIIQQTGQIVIANNATASLELHFGFQMFIYSQNALGGIQNLTLDPKRCILIGTSTYNFPGRHYLASDTSIFLPNNLTFYGVIYMPFAYVHVWNSGSTQQIYGAISAANIYFNHAVALHYDTSLRTAVFGGVDAPYMITDWRELTDTTERIVLP
jgi:hypothetical protein